MIGHGGGRCCHMRSGSCCEELQQIYLSLVIFHFSFSILKARHRVESVALPELNAKGQSPKTLALRMENEKWKMTNDK